MTSTCKPTRNVALDLIRVVAIVLVLWQHASEYYYIGDNLSIIHANIPLLTWMNSVARICVPLFVMISGYLLLPVSTSTATFFRRRFTRILFPWVFWCVAYAVYFMLRSGDGIATCIASVCRIPLNYGVEVGHLWYIYMLIGVYLLAPIVSPWLRQCGKRELQGYLALWMLTTLLPYLHHAGIALWGEASWNVTPAFYYYTGFGGYFILGHYLRRYGCPRLSVYRPDLPLLRLLCQGCRRDRGAMGLLLRQRDDDDARHLWRVKPRTSQRHLDHRPAGHLGIYVQLRHVSGPHHDTQRLPRPLRRRCTRGCPGADDSPQHHRHHLCRSVVPRSPALEPLLVRNRLTLGQ